MAFGRWVVFKRELWVQFFTGLQEGSVGIGEALVGKGLFHFWVLFGLYEAADCVL